MMLGLLWSCNKRRPSSRLSTQASAAYDASIDAAEAGSSTSSLAKPRKPDILRTGAHAC